MTTDFQVATSKIISTNPATGEILREFECVSEYGVRVAVERARAAQPAWNRLGVRSRVATLRKFQRLLHESKARVARTITLESGKPYVESLMTEVLVVLDAVRFCRQSSFAFLRDQPVPHGNLAAKMKAGRILREPYGVIGIISPWNYPFAIPSAQSVAALVAGNTVVLKPSEMTPLSALELASLLHQAGVPEDVFQVLPGEGSVGAALIQSPIDKLIFTGSANTGKHIAQAAAARLLPVVLELGGKDPMLVLDDANVEVASSGAVWGAFVNAGQACLSIERCYVHRSLYEQFRTACVRKTEQLRVGNGMDPQTDVGPLISRRQLRIVEEQVEDARRHGASVLTGGRRLPELGPTFYAPTILAEVTHEMLVMCEETFGPLLPIMAFDSDEDAVQLANDSNFGLSASIWTRNRARGETLARRIKTGSVMLNDAVSCFGISEAPHGGVKASGVGRTQGKFGLEEMVRTKYLDVDRLPGTKKAWWYSYSEQFARQTEGLLDVLFAQDWTRRLRGALGSAGILMRKEKL